MIRTDERRILDQAFLLFIVFLVLKLTGHID
jgi:hypothetical protein